jgi:Sec-independent protein secretion pathway component TatC
MLPMIVLYFLSVAMASLASSARTRRQSQG